MVTSSALRSALTVAAAVLLATGAATATAAAGSGPRDVTAEQCQDAGGWVEGSGYCVGAVGDDDWGQPVEGQAINPHPAPGEE
ncbi:hypothetical protein P3T27_000505 [Kitasatospora sp. MAA19]|uniref:hypothetical protein n=1 Tax=unclassified Kitasatospora TaxID=2633591 RepID=UPI00247643C2|nr:hypothetical protein [Kitasatospora sp. MAA19]MDH6703824.1 hypothetical protein [Kitasatospora sp. MAA19]